MSADHLTKLHDTDPQRFIELTRELIEIAKGHVAMSKAEGWDLPQWSKTLAAFDPPSPTYCEQLLERLKADGWREPTKCLLSHQESVKVYLSKNKGISLIPPETKP